jgi:hypothetical protein
MPRLELELPRTRGRQDLASAIRSALERHDITEASLAPAPGSGSLQGSARVWTALHDPALGELDGVHVALPVPLEARLESGRALVDVGQPGSDALAEAGDFVRSLASRGEIATRAHPVPGATHRLEVDAAGRRLLRRARHSSPQKR